MLTSEQMFHIIVLANRCSNARSGGFNMAKVKITVLKKEYYADFAEKYLTDGKAAGYL
jgi:hypothetical protein